MKTLPINLDTFSFVTREKRNGKTVIFRCGRDFIYHALHYYLPDKFNQNICSHVDIENRRLLGFKLPFFLMWTFLNFFRLPNFLNKQGLELEINNGQIVNFWVLIKGMLFSRISYKEAIKLIENRVDLGKVSGIDVSLKWFGLVDHVIFVYGYDEDNIYVIDTLQVPHLEYEKIQKDRFIMKLPKNTIEKRWTRLGRVWSVNKK